MAAKNTSLAILIVIDFWLPLGAWGQGYRLRTQKSEKNMDISKSGLLRVGVGREWCSRGWTRTKR